MKRAEGGNRPDETAGHHIPDGGAASHPVPKLGISAEPGRPELGGRRALSLDSLLDDGWDWPDPEPDYLRDVDWTLLASSLRLNSIETRVLLAIWGQGFPVRRLHIKLGISQRKAWQLYGSVRSKLGIVDRHLIGGCLSLEPVSNSRRLTYVDRLPSGARVSSLAFLDERFQQIMHEEKFRGLISERDPLEFQQPARFRARLGAKMEDLHKQLHDERARAIRVAEKVEDARLAFKGIDAEIDALNRAMDEEQIEANLQERPANVAAATKKLASLEGTRREKRAALTGAERALERQAEIIREIEGQIAAKRHEAFLRATADVRSKIRSMVEELGATALEYDNACREHGMDAWEMGRALFPWNPHSPLDGSMYRGAACQVVSAALRLCPHMWDRKNALEAEAAAAAA
jgi:hypothetical protein